MIFRNFIFLVGVFILSSCSHAPVVEKVQDDSSAVVGTVLNQDLLKQGGDLALVALKAGSKAEANDEVDHIGLSVLKGVKDSMDSQNSSLRIIAPDQGKPAVVLEGYVEEFSKPGRMSRVMLKPNRYHLEIKGELWLQATGQRLLNFSVQRSFNPKKDKLVDVSYQIGKDIGDYIGSQTK